MALAGFPEGLGMGYDSDRAAAGPNKISPPIELHQYKHSRSAQWPERMAIFGQQGKHNNDQGHQVQTRTHQKTLSIEEDNLFLATDIMSEFIPMLGKIQY